MLFTHPIIIKNYMFYGETMYLNLFEDIVVQKHSRREKEAELKKTVNFMQAVEEFNDEDGDFFVNG